MHIFYKFEVQIYQGKYVNLNHNIWLKVLINKPQLGLCYIGSFYIIKIQNVYIFF